MDRKSVGNRVDRNCRNQCSRLAQQSFINNLVTFRNFIKVQEVYQAQNSK